jgi:phosphate uptake regulator
MIKMMTFRTRKLQQVKGSFFVPLPPEWVHSNSMKKSDPIEIVLLDDGNLKISPVPQPGQGIEGTVGAADHSLKECVSL